MALKLHTIKPASGSRASKTRVGRGMAAGKGKTSGRGHKGQGARSGGKSGLKLKGMKQTLQSIPKVRGFKSGKPAMIAINVGELEKMEIVQVSPAVLKKLGRVSDTRPGVKILGRGELTRALKVSGCAVSASARQKIEAAGGSIA